MCKCFMYMNVCKIMYINICMYIYMCMYACKYACMYMYDLVSVYAYVVRIHICMYELIYVCTIFVYKCIYVCVYVDIIFTICLPFYSSQLLLIYIWHELSHITLQRLFQPYHVVLHLMHLKVYQYLI